MHMSKNTKRVALIFSALALVAAGCGSDSDSSSDTTVAVAETEAPADTAAPAETEAPAEATETTAAAAAETTAAAAAAAGGKAGFILPDSKSSARWEAFDRPLIEAACAAAGIECDIQNAEGDKVKMATIADQMITGGVKVLAIVNLDSESGAAIQAKAAEAGVKNIDYDRLTLGGKADVYVSFDNVAVGTAQGQGIIQCLGGAEAAKGKKIIQLHGSPTDNNATLFRQGYQAAIEGSGLETVGEEAVPDWDNQKAVPIFEQLLQTAGGKIDGVLVANDGLSLAAQSVLTKSGLTAAATGQDATVDGLRAILQGTQCMTVYKPVKAEAEGAVAAAVALLNGEAPAANATINNEVADIPYVQAQVTPIYKEQVKDVIADGFVTRDDVCKDIEEACTAAGV
jgi:D-xylose transport system substrate-binding protein